MSNVYLPGKQYQVLIDFWTVSINDDLSDFSCRDLRRQGLSNSQTLHVCNLCQVMTAIMGKCVRVEDRPNGSRDVCGIPKILQRDGQ